ncbi:decaprenyl-phosphate phosphoribosyltransferase [Xanthovirga aplysinae]|uniref:decaprenyl-phosphate phosphoribosyltransferase n=1 Tax=Xanthovirga aplysinae TaxID=2529853 RepID=UPI0012BC439B|nr:decaprenyl-phosphate phosphoribosyltransferase [Xanthovirga aplysinae]MTI33406.1 decaprenyl-phosphate phosphoribosyltransferase [Xanthovirga aplysinae]
MILVLTKDLINHLMVILRLCRVDHYIKNLFILTPLYFSGELFEFQKLKWALLGLISFSLVGSTIYIFNDIKDAEADRLHPVKKSRPIAAQEINISWALSLSFFLLLGGLSLAYYINKTFFFLIITYLLMNIAYTIFLKRLPLIDIFIISIGFVLRVISGGVISQVKPSHWLIIMVFLLSLFLALGKRRDDLILLKKSNQKIRESVETYNLRFVDACLTMICGIIIVCYLMYCISSQVINQFHSEYLYGTFIFVLAGVMRYLQIFLVKQRGGSPVKILFKDPFTLINLTIWLLSFYIIIYTSNL